MLIIVSRVSLGYRVSLLTAPGMHRICRVGRRVWVQHDFLANVSGSMPQWSVQRKHCDFEGRHVSLSLWRYKV